MTPWQQEVADWIAEVEPEVVIIHAPPQHVTPASAFGEAVLAGAAAMRERGQEPKFVVLGRWPAS